MARADDVFRMRFKRIDACIISIDESRIKGLLIDGSLLSKSLEKSISVRVITQMNDY